MSATTDSTQGAPLSMSEILSQQNFGLAIVAGLGAAAAGAGLWAVVTVVSQMKLGLIAVAVGYLVGQAIKATGKGVDAKFGYLGAVCAFLGCGVGDVLSDIAFYGQHNGMSFGDALSGTNMDLLTRLVPGFFQPMDLLFYGIAIYEGYKFSFKYRRLKR